jgi:hypothetical protein
MLDALIFVGAGMTFAGLVALANPFLLGWRSRRDAVVVLAIALVAMAIGGAPRFW